MTFTFTGFDDSLIFEADWALYNHLNVDLQRLGQEVSHVTGEDRTVQVAVGFTRIKGILVRVTAAHNVQANPNGTGNPRIDTLVWEVDWPGQTVSLVFVQGTAASNPSPPALTQVVNGIWQEPIAQVRVNPGQGSFNADSVTTVGPPVGVPWALVGPRAFIRRRLVGDVHRAVGSNSVSKLQSWEDQRTFGEPFTHPFGTGTVSPPQTGLYLIIFRAYLERTNTNQSGGVFVQFRSGVSSTANDSGNVIRSQRVTMGSYMGSQASQTVTLTDFVHLSSSSVCSFTINNSTGHTIRVLNRSPHTSWSLMYFGPSSGLAEVPEDPGEAI